MCCYHVLETSISRQTRIMLFITGPIACRLVLGIFSTSLELASTNLKRTYEWLFASKLWNHWLTWRRRGRAAVLFVWAVSTIITAVTHPYLINTLPISTGHLVAPARALLFIWHVSTVVQAVTPPIHFNAFAIFALKLTRWTRRLSSGHYRGCSCGNCGCFYTGRWQCLLLVPWKCCWEWRYYY